MVCGQEYECAPLRRWGPSKTSILWPIHEQKRIVGTKRHELRQCVQGEPADALELPRHQQSSVQGNARHDLKGTAAAHYLRGEPRFNASPMPSNNPMESTHLLVFIYRNLKTLIAVGFLAAVAASGCPSCSTSITRALWSCSPPATQFGRAVFRDQKNDLLLRRDGRRRALAPNLNSHRIRNRIIENTTCTPITTSTSEPAPRPTWP